MYLALSLLCAYASLSGMRVFFSIRKNGFSRSVKLLVFTLAVSGFLGAGNYLMLHWGIDPKYLTDFIRVFLWAGIGASFTGMIYFSKGAHE